MEAVLIVIGILTIITLAVGIYRLANRDKHEASILRVHGKVQRRENFSTVIFAIISIIRSFRPPFHFHHPLNIP